MNLLSKNQLKNLAAYRQQKRCDEEGLFVVEGVKLCTEAMASDFTIRTVCMTNDFLSTAEGRSMAGRLEQRGCEITEVTDDQLERLSNQRTPNKVWMLVERHAVAPASTKRPKPYTTPDAPSPLAGESEPTDDNTQQVKVETRTKAQLRKDIREAQRKMQLAAKEMDFLTAARYRDEIRAMQAALDTARGE